MGKLQPTSGATAYIGIGCNLGSDEEKLERMRRAVGELEQLPGSKVVRVAPLYRSEAWGVTDQPDFFNSVALVRTGLSPAELLRGLRGIERKLGRKPRERWGAREMDLDILLFDAERIVTKDLVVPHPHLLERDFVVLPLLELDPEARLPDGRTIAQAAPLFRLGESIQRIKEEWTGDLRA